MRLINSILLLLLFSPSAWAVAGCGKGTDQSQCGNVGGSFSTAGQTGISACNLALAPGAYFLTQDVTATPYLTNTAAQSACFVFNGHGITLNLNGHTVTGGLYANSTAENTEVYNGTVSHDIVYGSTIGVGLFSYGGVYFASLGCPPSSPLKIHHLTIVAGVDAAFNVYVDYSSVSTLCSIRPTALIYNVTSTAPANSVSSRTGDFYLLGNDNGFDPLSVYDNLLTCPGSANACQGVALYSAANSLVYNNDIVLDINTTHAGGGDNARGVILDGGGASSSATWYTAGNVTGCAGCTVYNNTVTVNNNRCFRTRNSINYVFHDNECLGVVNSGGVTGAYCFHLGDPDQGDADMQSYSIYNNTCDLGPGVPGIHLLRMWSSTGGGTIFNNTYTCNAGGCAGAYIAQAVQPQGTGTRSIMTIHDETSALPGQATSNFMVTGDKGRSAAQSGNPTDDTVQVNSCNVGSVGLSNTSPIGAVSPIFLSTCTSIVMSGAVGSGVVVQ